MSGAIIVASILVPTTRVAATTTLPVIVTYELAKQQDAQRSIARDPRRFWFYQIAARLEDKKPASPVGLKSDATVLVDFTVGRDGHVLSKGLKRSSGEPAIDAIALAMIKRAQPFPPMPAGVDDKNVSFILPLRFR